MSSSRLLGWVAVSGAAVAAVVLACGSDASGSSAGALGAGTADPVVQIDFYPGLVKAICTDIQPCCANAGNAFVQGQCTTTLGVDAGALQGGIFAAVVGTNGVALTYDPQAAGDCLAGIAAYQKTCPEVVSELDSFKTFARFPQIFRCSAVFKGGTKKPGEACAEAYECAFQDGALGGCSETSQADGGRARVCNSTMPAKLGEPCTPDADDGIAERHVCELDGFLAGVFDVTKLNHCDATSRTCQPYTVVADGTACDATKGTVCKDITACVDALCVARPAAGGACTKDSGCVTADKCDPASKTCVPRNATGTPCAQDDDCQTRRCNASKVCASAFEGISAGQLCGGR